MKAMKMQSNVQANTMNAWEWEYEAEKRQQEKKSNKALRDMKKGRKRQWQIEA